VLSGTQSAVAVALLNCASRLPRQANYRSFTTIGEQGVASAPTKEVRDGLLTVPSYCGTTYGANLLKANVF
jgi:hypothetical protein